jgi:hypothetical protein
LIDGLPGGVLFRVAPDRIVPLGQKAEGIKVGVADRAIGTRGAEGRPLALVVVGQAATATNHWENVRDVPIVVGDDVTLVAIAATNYCDRSMWTATASVRGDNIGPPGAVDGDLTTRWDSAHVQNGTDWFQVDFGGSVQLTSITLNNTETFPGDYPGAYEIRGSVDGVSFDGAPFVGGAGANGSTVVNFAPRAVRAVRVAQVGTANSRSWWGIGEFQTACAMFPTPP